MRRAFAGVALAGVLAACGGGGDEKEGAGGAANLSGRITADGSSTVFPVTEAVAEEFMTETGGQVQVTVATSGTGGGFKRFCAGEVDVANASRPIKDSEKQACAAAGIEFIELPVALDGLAVLVNPANTFAQCLTTAELKRIWEPESQVRSWAQVRPGFPDQPLKLYGPGTNSGTFDYFTEAVVGKEDASRSDYTASEDDNVLVTGVSGDASALGYFGYAYFAENRQRLKAVQVDGGQGCVEPTPQTIESGQYAPLSRPLLIYVKKASLARPEVKRFVEFYLQTAAEMAAEVGYIPLSAARYQEATATLSQATGGAG
ncbi:MAG TPA: PstS family phosphate ABC transporter substrate-binding protein [Longimicrobium sp.]|nr:PstS family phosphate ABC transporter substrate-binding protein [Longimicrobium sp.]